MNTHKKKSLATIPWAILLIVCALLTGCTTAGLYGQNSQRLDAACRAFSSGDWTEAKAEFTALADQTNTPNAVATGRYGLTCLAMASASDIPSFLNALETLSRFPDPQRFKNQNPVLLLAGVQNGIRLMEEKQEEQKGRIQTLLDEKKQAGNQNHILEKTLKNLKYQLREIERIDRDLQEKRNPS